MDVNRRTLRITIVMIATALLQEPPAFCGTAEFKPTIANKNQPPGKAPESMVWIPGGEFSMGAALNGEGSHEMPMASNDSQPVHRVYVDGFWMDATAVTNAQFEKFVRATNYVTIAERTPTKEEFPTAAEENLVAGSVVFAPTDHEVSLNDYYQWWSYVKGATWRHPLGPQSEIKGKDNYPVVQIAYPDAEAYAKWAGKRLALSSARLQKRRLHGQDRIERPLSPDRIELLDGMLASIANADSRKSEVAKSGSTSAGGYWLYPLLLFLQTMGVIDQVSN